MRPGRHRRNRRGAAPLPRTPPKLSQWQDFLKAGGVAAAREMIRDLRLQFGTSNKVTHMSTWVALAQEAAERGFWSTTVTQMGNQLLHELVVNEAWKQHRIPRAQVEAEMRTADTEASAADRAIAKLAGRAQPPTFPPPNRYSPYPHHTFQGKGGKGGKPRGNTNWN